MISQYNTIQKNKKLIIFLKKKETRGGYTNIRQNTLGQEVSLGTKESHSKGKSCIIF